MINHCNEKHQAPEGDPIDEICYGTLEPITEDDIFKMQSPLYHPDLAQTDKPKQQSCKELPAHTSSRDRHRSSRGYLRSKSSHNRSQKCLSKCPAPKTASDHSSPKRRRDSAGPPQEGASDAQVRGMPIEAV